MTSEFEALKQQLEKPPKKRKAHLPYDKGLSSGLTLINLACSGRPDVAFLPGHDYMFVGDSQAGKSWLSMQLMAEAVINDKYKGYRIIHDNPEEGTLMDVRRYFGDRLAKRLERPGKGGNSRTIEEFYDYVDDAVKTGIPFLYVLDSEDALSSEDEIKRLAENKKARRKKAGKEDEAGEDGDGAKLKGSYGDGKAKKNSSGLRVAHNGLVDTGSILLMIKQTRDNIGLDAKFNPKVRSGGRALTFYASLELWFSIRGQVKRTVRGAPRTIGTYLKIQVKKNRLAGRNWPVTVRFYPSHGLDNTGSNIDYLVAEKHWKGTEEKVTAPEFDFSGSKDRLARLIEDGGRDQELVDLVTQVWQDVESQCEVVRRNRYVSG